MTLLSADGHRCDGNLVKIMSVYMFPVELEACIYPLERNHLKDIDAGQSCKKSLCAL